MRLPKSETDEVDQVAQLERRIAKLEIGIIHVMRARYTDGGEPYAIHEGCELLDHQYMRYEEKPKFKENRCFCGKVVEKEST